MTHLALLHSLALATTTPRAPKLTHFPFVHHAGVPLSKADHADPLAFKHYEPERLVLGKPMREWTRFSLAYWHTWRTTGADPFGLHGTMPQRLWSSDTLEAALHRIDAHFELCQKLGIDFYTFHDRDIVQEADSVHRSDKLLERCAEHLEEKQRETGVRLLWGTANLFSHPRYMHGSATSPYPLVLAHAAAQVKKSLEVTHRLGGAGFVLWGGRDGYQCLLNTDMEQEQRHYGHFLRLVADYAREIGFEGQLWLEPKPREPMAHQYHFDAETTLGFIERFGLADDYALNIEANHATLAGHTAEHEVAVAASRGKLGSIDINRNEAMLGWDTDMFPDDLALATFTMLHVVRQGGLRGGLNFDAKVRRESTDLEDLVAGHIAGMDVYARGLLAAEAIVESGELHSRLHKRYEGFGPHGAPEAVAFAQGGSSLAELADWASREPVPVVPSGKQEQLESIFRSFAFGQY